MSNVTPIGPTPPVEIRPGDKVEHRATGRQGTVFTMTDEVVRVSVNGVLVTGKLNEWRLI